MCQRPQWGKDENRLSPEKEQDEKRIEEVEFKVGHTMAVLYALQHEFMDMSGGIKLEWQDSDVSSGPKAHLRKQPES